MVHQERGRCVRISLFLGGPSKATRALLLRQSRETRFAFQAKPSESLLSSGARRNIAPTGQSPWHKRKANPLAHLLIEGLHRYSPLAIDMHSVLDMVLASQASICALHEVTRNIAPKGQSPWQRHKANPLAHLLIEGLHRYSPLAIDMHSVLDMVLALQALDMCFARDDEEYCPKGAKS